MRRVVLGALLMCVVGCGASPASPAPSSLPPPSPAPSLPTTTFHIIGIATDDDGNPVPGVQVRISSYSFMAPAKVLTATTDGRGSYDATFEGLRLNPVVGEITADQDGYESYTRFLVDTSTELVQNVRMYRARRLTAGQSVPISVRPDDSSYGFDLEWVGRTVRVISPATGKLNVSLEHALGVNRTGMEIVFGGRRMCCSPTTSVQVISGQEVIVRALLAWNAVESHTFTLTTSLTPE